jgi:hypothetical protein
LNGAFAPEIREMFREDKTIKILYISDHTEQFGKKNLNGDVHIPKTIK